MKQFNIGSKYETTVENFYDSCALVEVGQRFTCTKIGDDGACWSSSVQFHDQQGEWCVATLDELHSGAVIEVDA